VKPGALLKVISPEERKEVRMPLLQIVITLIVVGVLLGLVNRFIPMQSTIKSILNVIVVVCVAVWLLNIFGILFFLHGGRAGR
jgi:LytS/YehU family sensor histidine kinase